jgi:creatinine amidohydrolase
MFAKVYMENEKFKYIFCHKKEGFFMEWDKLASPDFAKAVKKTKGVCLLPIGCMEKHGGHLPLGTDILFVHKLCCLAAEKEPAMVFPYFYLSQISEARHQPGTVAISFKLLIPLLENICDEISRNGLKKIVIVNGHGGNFGLLSFFSMMFNDRKKDYTVYSVAPYMTVNCEGRKIFRAKTDGHGGEIETSQIKYFYPELVKSLVPTGNGLPLGRLKELKQNGISTGIDWYSDYPDHLCADKTPGSAEKGKILVDMQIGKLVSQIRMIKKDKTAPALFKEFHGRAEHK